MATATIAAATPAELRERARAHRESAAASFERCDTDGFMSQWASGMLARQDELQAVITEQGGRAKFTALFDTEGNLVAAKEVKTRYGWAWGILASDDPRGRFTGWFTPSKARDRSRAKAADARKGYFVGYVMAPAEAVLSGGHVATVAEVARRTDGGFSRDVEIVCNGQGEDLEEGLGGIYGRLAAIDRHDRERAAAR